MGMNDSVDRYAHTSKFFCPLAIFTYDMALITVKETGQSEEPIDLSDLGLMSSLIQARVIVTDNFFEGFRQGVGALLNERNLVVQQDGFACV